MAQSREEFMRSLGLTGDDVKNPEPSTKIRGGGRTSTMHNNMEDESPPPPAFSKSKKSTTAPSSHNNHTYDTPVNTYQSQRTAAASFEEMVDREYGAGYGQQQQQQRHQQQSATTTSAASPNSGGGSRADFLRSLGIDNYDGNANNSSANSGTKTHAEIVAERRGKTNTTTNNTNSSFSQRQSTVDQQNDSSSSIHYGRPNANNNAKENVSPPSSVPRSKAEGTKEAMRRAQQDADSEEDDCGGYASFRQQQPSSGAFNASSSSIQGVKKQPGASSGAYEPSLGLSGEVLNENASSDEIKQLGNKFYERGDYRKAVRLYTKAIEKGGQQNAALYSNRSAAYLLGSKQMGLDTRTMALRDADMTIKLRPEWFKGYSRKGDALFKLERFEEALEAYHIGLEKDPENSAVKHSIQEVTSMMPTRKKSEDSWANPNRKAPNTSKNAYELLAETDIPEGNDYRSKELEKFRTQRTSTPNGLNTTTSSVMSEGGAESTTSPTRPPLRRSDIPAEFSTNAAAEYQNKMLDEYRRKKQAKK